MKKQWKFTRTIPFFCMLVVLGLLIYIQEINITILHKIAQVFFMTFINLVLIFTFLYMVGNID